MTWPNFSYAAASFMQNERTYTKVSHTNLKPQIQKKFADLFCGLILP